MIITNETVLLIEQLKHVKARVKLREINGMMHYYYSEKRSSVILELKKGKVVKLHLSDPEKNE